MNTAKLVAALNTVSLAFAEIAEALSEPAIVAGSPAPSAAPVASGALTEPEFPPFAPEEPVYEAIPLPADSPGLGRCPNHGTAWTVKAAGTGAKGAYSAFWRCAEKDASETRGYCQKRPAKAWADAHPLT